MSNFEMKELHQINGIYRSTFQQIALIAKKNGIRIEITAYPDGDVEVKSAEHFTENNKDCVRYHEITEGKNRVSQKTETIVLKEVAE